MQRAKGKNFHMKAPALSSPSTSTVSVWARKHRACIWGCSMWWRLLTPQPFKPILILPCSLIPCSTNLLTLYATILVPREGELCSLWGAGYPFSSAVAAFLVFWEEYGQVEQLWKSPTFNGCLSRLKLSTSIAPNKAWNGSLTPLKILNLFCTPVHPREKTYSQW